MPIISSSSGNQLLLHFYDGAFGVFDFMPFLEADTPMTRPLRDPAFFARHFIEVGAEASLPREFALPL